MANVRKIRWNNLPFIALGVFAICAVPTRPGHGWVDWLMGVFVFILVVDFTVSVVRRRLVSAGEKP